MDSELDGRPDPVLHGLQSLAQGRSYHWRIVHLSGSHPIGQEAFLVLVSVLLTNNFQVNIFRVGMASFYNVKQHSQKIPSIICVYKIPIPWTELLLY
jgi:hypothetical protein